MQLDSVIHREWICKYISSEYGTKERRTKYFQDYLAGTEVKRWQEFDNLYDLFKKYGPKEDETSEHARAECAHRWIRVLYVGTEYEHYNFLESYESFTYVDGPGSFHGFQSDEALNEHLRSHYRFNCVLRSTSDYLSPYAIDGFPEDLSPSTLKGFIIPRRGEDQS